MPHSTHFLQRLERASAVETDLALELYRDPELVALLLEKLRRPPEEERFALSLDARDQGPWLVLSCRGDFITCLGEGMEPVGLDRIGYAELQSRLSQLRQDQARMRAIEEACAKHDLGQLYVQIFRAGHRVSRDELQKLAPLGHINAERLLRRALHLFPFVDEQLPHLYRPRKGKLGSLPDLAEAHWKIWWAINHLSVLAAWHGRKPLARFLEHAAEQNIPLSRFFLLQGDLAGGLRGLWMIGRFGKPQLAAHKEQLDDPERVIFWVGGVTALMILGLRHAKLKSEAVKALTAAASSPQVTSSDLAELFGPLLDTALVTLEQPDLLHAELVQIARDCYLSAVQQGRIAPPYCWKTPAEVPEELALPFWLNQVRLPLLDPDAVRLQILAAPWLARAEGGDLYLPQSFLDAFRDPWTLELSDDLVRRNRICYRPVPTVVSTPRPGRNELCPCGSGKKYKKCCGA